MATILELAKLSSAAYGDPAPQGWIPLTPCASNSNGYFGQAYQNSITHEIVIANRGTRGLSSIDDLLADFQLSLHLSQPAQQDAVNYALMIAMDYPGAPIIETGHSLGGNEAQAATVALTDKNVSVSAVTFNAPGIGGYPIDPTKNYNVCNYYDQGDAIHLAGGTHLGSSVLLPAGPNTVKDLFLSPLNSLGAPGMVASLENALYEILLPAHSINTVIGYLAGEGSALGNVNWTAQGSASPPPQLSDPTLQLTYSPGSFGFTDTKGNSATFTIANDNTILGDTWTSSDGSTGSIDYSPSAQQVNETVTNTDGSSEMVVANIDGSRQSSKFSADGSGRSDTIAVDGTKSTTVYLVGRIAKSTKIDKMDGSGSMTQFFDNGSVCSSKTVDVDGSSSYTIYYQDGSMSSKSILNSDGSGTMTHYYDNGPISNNTISNADGSGIATSYFSDGNISSVLISKVDGSGSATAYYSNGNIMSVLTDSADGSISRTSYFENGGISTIETQSGGMDSSTEYYENGTVRRSSYVPISSPLDYVFGTATYFYPIGSLSEHSLENGTFSLYPNGQRSKQSVLDSYGRLQTVSYYANGAISARTTSVNGVVTYNAEYYLSGFSSEEFLDLNDGSIDTVMIYYPNGNPASMVATYPIAGYHGEVFTTDYYGNGQISKASHVVDSLGFRADVTYRPSGQETSLSWNGDSKQMTYDIGALVFMGASNQLLTKVFGCNDSVDSFGGNEALYWLTIDSLSGSVTFNADGSCSGSVHNLDGSYSTYSNDGKGWITTTSYDASGNNLGSSTPTNDGSGGVTTVKYSATGTKLSVSQTDMYGRSSTNTFDANGNVNGTIYSNGNPDSHYSTDLSGNGTLIGGAGNDTIYGWNSSLTLIAGSGNQALYSQYGHEVLTGGSGNDTLISVVGNDTLVAGSGLATMVGSAGNDIFVINNANDLIIEQPNAGTNTIQTSVSYVLPGNVQNITGTGSGNLTLTGNNLANVITANDGNDTLIAGSGLATLVGGSGNDTFVINNVGDVITEQANGGNNTVQTSVSFVLPANVQNIAGTGSAAITLTGNNIDNVITGNSGTDRLVAGSGNATLVAGSGLATLIGGTGNDTFVINNVGDVIIEAANTGTNTVQTSVSYVLPANVQNITGRGTGNLTLTGNNLTNVITANNGKDKLVAGSGTTTLVSGSGVDTLVAGAGNDTFIINNSSDVITVATAKAGNVVQSSVSYVLPANLLNLTGIGSAAITLTGNALADTITANNGNDTLIAGSGLATLIGGAGNDTFVVNNVGDVIIEAANAGTNTVKTSVSYVLPANVQNITGTGSAALTLTGNSLNNVITANSGNDTLIAGTGPATLVGGAGNDTFVINNTADVIIKAATTGTNTVQTSVSYITPANVQNITGTGTGSLTLTGNSLKNVITANSGNDTLIAGTGLATLIGGTGNNTFVVNNAADVVTAKAGAVLNTIQSSVSYTAAANVTNLFLTGTANLTATGNSGNDLLIANSGNDTLIGGAGTNVLQGGAGADTLKELTGKGALLSGAGNDTITGGTGVSFIDGGTGNDTLTLGSAISVVAFNNGGGKDTIVAGTGVANVLSLGGGINYANLTFSKSGNNLILGNGTADSITFQNWYSSTANHDFVTLQVLEQASSTYSATSTNTLYNQKIETFDFGKLVTAFNQALAATPTLTSWNLMSSLLSDHLSGSDTTTLGGDLAYYDGLNGNLTGLNLATAVSTLQNTAFGKTAQTTDAWSGVSASNNKLH